MHLSATWQFWPFERYWSSISEGGGGAYELSYSMCVYLCGGWNLEVGGGGSSEVWNCKCVGIDPKNK